MPRYRYVGDSPRLFPELGLDLEPGDEFESEQEIDSPELELVQEPQAPAEPAEPPVAKE